MDYYFFIIIFAVCIVPIGIGLWIDFRKNKERQNVLKQVSQSWNIPDLQSGKIYQAVYEGMEYEYEYFAGTRKYPSYFKIRIKCLSKGEFVIGKESKLDAWARNVGISCEIQTGDVQFDEEFYIRTNSVDFTTAYFFLPQKREAVKDLFRLGFNKLKHDGKILEMTMQPFDSPESRNPTFIPEVVRRIKILGENIPEGYPENLIGGMSHWKVKRTVVFSVMGIVLAVGIVGSIVGTFLYLPLDDGDILLFSLKYSMSWFAIFLVLAVIFLKGRSSSHTELMGVFFLGLLGFVFAGNGLLVLANGYFDTAPESYHDSVVVDKYITDSRDSTNYHIRVKSWREGKSSETLSVLKGEYDRAAVGKTIVHVVTKPGKYGFEWLVRQNLK